MAWAAVAGCPSLGGTLTVEFAERREQLVASAIVDRAAVDRVFDPVGDERLI